MTTDNQDGLPAPRLEFRWRYATADDKDCIGQYVCEYGLVMPLREHDIRREVWDNGEDTGERRPEAFYKFCKTGRGASQDPFPGDTPYRDGAHSLLDSEALGGLPIYVRGIDGTTVPKHEFSARLTAPPRQ